MAIPLLSSSAEESFGAVAHAFYEQHGVEVRFAECTEEAEAHDRWRQIM